MIANEYFQDIYSPYIMIRKKLDLLKTNDDFSQRILNFIKFDKKLKNLYFNYRANVITTNIKTDLMIKKVN